MSNQTIELRLYVAGDSPRSRGALNSIRCLEDSSLAGRYRLEVIDVLQEPVRAEADRILATPTLLRLSPPPACRILGDLANLDHLVRALGVQAVGERDDETSAGSSLEVSP